MKKLILVIAFLLFCSKATAVQFSDVYVFGPSYVDSGNRPHPAPYFDDRASNGYNLADRIAQHYTSDYLEPSRLGGTNYAVGGARSSDVLSQTNQIVSDHGTLDSNALYLAMPGVWDVLDTFNNQTPSPYQQAIDTALGNINSAFTNLVNNGARNFLILNFIDAAQHPRYSSDTNASQLTTNIEIMNSGLADIAKQPVSRLSVA